jgi:hypothetical protein
LTEVLLGGVVLAVAVVAILGAYVGQVTLNEHSRNLSLAIHDANRIIEQIRQQNATCTNPTVVPTGFTSWNLWLEWQVPGKSIVSPTPNNDQLVVVTCSHRDGPTAGKCGSTQVGAGEWSGNFPAAAGSQNPLRLTVTVCWRHRARIIGECRATGGVGPGLEAWPDAPAPGTDDPDVIQSPAMLTTLVTCRG